MASNKDEFLSRELSQFSSRRMWLRGLYKEGLISEGDYAIGTLLIDLLNKEGE